MQVERWREGQGRSAVSESLRGERRGSASSSLASGHEPAASMVDECALSHQSIVWLQQAAGNAVVARLLRQKSAGITVHPGSDWDAKEFAKRLMGNPHVPASVRKNIRGTKKGSLVLDKNVKPEKGRIGAYAEGFNTAFKKGQSVITTAKSKIVVTKDAHGRLKWDQVVTPDLGGEQLGQYEKTGFELGDRKNKKGPVQITFTKAADFRSDQPEIIYGWTPGKFSTKRDKIPFILIMIVTQIEVTNPNKVTKTFKPDPNMISEAILHEISIHAARQSVKQPDVHDTSAVIKDLVEEIGDFFRLRNTKDQLEPSKTTTEIMNFIRAPAAGRSPAPATPRKVPAPR